jgi:hypothetical protein
VAKHETIAAEDKDFAITYKKLALLSTVHLFDFCRLFNNMDVPFDVVTLRETIENEDDLEDFMDIFLDPIFGTKSNLTY